MTRPDNLTSPQPPRWFPVALMTLGLPLVLLAWIALGSWPAVATATATILAGGVWLRWLFDQHTLQSQRTLTDTRNLLDDWQQRWRILHAESRQNAMVLLQMADGVVVIAADLSILLLNPSARRLLELREDVQWLGRDFREVVRIPELVAAVETVRGGGETMRVNVEISARGQVRPLSVCVNQVEAGSDGTLLLTVRDETETRRLEEVRREFIANVSHELKTPLAAIKGYAETVELAIDDDPQAATHFMSQIRSQCLRLERLVADMMQLARAQAGGNKLRPASIILGDVIGESIRTYQPVADAKQIRLVRGEFDAAVKAFVDREATLTIANNLIGNAIRYTPEGGCVTVSVRVTADASEFVVQDTGVGIAARELDRIFERFYRVEKTRESAVSGTGLGLAIAKNLTIALGGTIHVQSQPGKGSTFSVRLPASRREAGPTPQPAVVTRF